MQFEAASGSKWSVDVGSFMMQNGAEIRISQVRTRRYTNIRFIKLSVFYTQR